ncbi:hypothetical protein FKM82_017979 [Ascaphus truei]
MHSISTICLTLFYFHPPLLLLNVRHIFFLMIQYLKVMPLLILLPKEAVLRCGQAPKQLMVSIETHIEVPIALDQFHLAASVKQIASRQASGCVHNPGDLWIPSVVVRTKN